ncbi:hypothetical protein [Halorientalis persicus]|uniref:hypothetical protein n=1 Tax=Halorientalis persicus TaxID=1367881 RepID=UPI000B8A4D55|nr:hypothetical protein [Halorientalis persicus]
MERAIRGIYNGHGDVLLEALPVAGKSYSALKIASKTETPLLYLASRDYLKSDAEAFCDKFGLTHKRIPTPHKYCPAFDRSDQDHYDGRAVKSYKNGVGGREIHERLDDIRCGGDCRYLDLLNFDPSAPDVLIGDPSHAYRDEYLKGRFVVKDEFSVSEFETEFKNPQQVVDRFLQSVTLRYDSYQDVLNAQPDDNRCADALDWYGEHGLYQDTSNVLESPNEEYHALAPTLTFALLAGHELGNGWERLPVSDWADLFGINASGVNSNAICVRDPDENTMYLLNPPNFDIADGFLGLDGTPTPAMWRIATGLDLTHRDVLEDREKRKYVSDVLNHTIIRTNDDLKPYQNNRNGSITAPKDTQILHWIHRKEGEKPGFITSKKAIDNVYPEYNDGELFDYVDTPRNFSNVLSYQGFADKHLGFVSGSRHYGDPYIKKWGAYAGEAVASNSKRGTAKSYGEFGNKIHRHMKRQTLQDVLRFGRDTEPTTVYVNTAALPDWVPSEAAHLVLFSEDAREVAGYLQDEGTEGGKVGEIATETGVKKRNARKKAEALAENGFVTKYDDLPDAAAYVWDESE